MNKETQHLPPYKNFSIDVLRLDLIHPYYGGNKYFKLKYNVISAETLKQSRNLSGQGDELPILTFGGAHSNHIYSTAAFCHEHKLKVIGVIRGESSLIEQSPTLQFAQKQGMHLHFISRERYKNKTDNDLIEELKQEFGDFYMIPEGGNNELGIKGCMEIMDQVPTYDYVFCACGTVCTYTGILASAKSNQKIIGVSVLKGENALMADVNKNAANFQFTHIKPFSGGKLDHSAILDQYHFGGYAKHTKELLNFKNTFEADHHIPLDYIYTSKLFYAVYDLINKGQLMDNSSVLIVHS
ncbi:MAG: 1-aminocyclopropane-1-carboxylate deaminase/D-cysteine desulfhydrase, partial [Sphingobacteriaceae bacterium]